MSSQPEYVDEVGACTYAALNLGCFAVVWLGGLGLALVVPGAWEQRWWVWLWGVAGALTIAFAAVWFGPMLLKGGTYRVAIRVGRLEVSSPSGNFGPSFAVPLKEIAALIHRPVAEGPDLYEVHTRSGEVFPVCSASGERLLAAFRRLHPEVPIEHRH